MLSLTYIFITNLYVPYLWDLVIGVNDFILGTGLYCLDV